MVGPEAEKTALVRHVCRMFVTAASLTVPWFTVVLRKGYGLGAQAMAGGGFHAQCFTVSWPTGEFGGMGLEGAVRLGFRKELQAIADPAERENLFRSMVARYYETGKATNIASVLEIDQVIDPIDTRHWIIRGLEVLPDAAAPRDAQAAVRRCVVKWPVRSAVRAPFAYTCDMRIVTYRDLRPGRFAKALERLRAALGRGDFAAAGLKKLAPTTYWRAKLSDEARLLVQFVPYNGETVCLFLEVIADHAYEKSRFLRGAPVDRDKIEAGPDDFAPAPEPKARLGFELKWLPPEAVEFDLLDKPIVLDAAQEAVRRHAPPVVIIGPAGSGKTAVTLAKMREATGDVLYVTLSAYLAQTARRLYGAHGYENPHQNAEFMSFREFVDTIAVPEGEEVRFPAFRTWLERRRGGLKGDLRQADAHALFEEFRGVLGAPANGALTESQYQALGVRQSLYPAGDERAAAHDLFEKYRAWLKEEKLFDLNLVSHEWRARAEPRYDFVVVDEVQDFTNAELALILDTLKTRHHFLLCGDSHQIVHPNFFSWASVRALFWGAAEAAEDAAAAREISVLQTNFRNTEAVTGLANRLLKVKHARFGSVDRESSFLVRCASSAAGAAQLLKGKTRPCARSTRRHAPPSATPSSCCATRTSRRRGPISQRRSSSPSTKPRASNTRT